jgi:hypothetical protein
MGLGTRLAIVAGILWSFAACDTAPPVQTLPEITFGHMAPIKLDVRTIEIVSNYRPPMKPPNVEHLLRQNPEASLRRWANDRLRAVGSAGTARLVIANASIVETALAKESGFKATFTTQQSERYYGTIDAAIEILDARGAQRGFAAARSAHARTVAENITLYNRERAWFELSDLLMKDFNEEIELNMRRYLTNWIVP